MAPACKERQTAQSGRGLFSSKDLKAGSLVLEDKAPFVAVLDSPVLTTTCSWCFVFTEEANPEDQISVSACTGCKIVRYCGKTCQTASWKHSHKYECKVFKALYPQVLPNTARMILQILLRKKNNCIPKDEWEEFLKLQHHMDNLEKSAKTGNEYHQQTLQNVQLMARAGKEYSASPEQPGFVESLVGRLITNTSTLTSPIFTPLGLCLSLQTSIANHSCKPNTAITFNGRTLSLRAVESLKAETELTISYINTTLLLVTRKAELSSRYNFNCLCNQCSNNLTLNHIETDLPPPSLSSLTTRQTFEAEIITFLTTAKSKPASEALHFVASAFKKTQTLHPSYPAWLSPLYQLRFDLITACQAQRLYVAAFIHAVILHFKAQHIVYPSVAHPARVARTWVHAKMAGHIGGLANEPDFAQEIGAEEEGNAARALEERFELDWGMVVYLFVKEVSDHVLKSHGVQSRFSMEVGREMRRLREEAEGSGRGEPTSAEMEEAKKKLVVVAEDGWEWWKNWMKERRRKEITDGDAAEKDALSILLE